MIIALHLLIFALSCTSLVHADSKETRAYYQELKDLKKKGGPHAILFDKDASPIVRDFIRDIDNAKNLSPFKRFVRFVFLSMDTVVVTQQTLPKLFSYVETLCKKNDIEPPVIFITKDKWLFNAAAQKLFMSSGGIIIGQELMSQVSDSEFEAIVAHEIGHIKHNHINKSLLTNAVTLPIIYMLINKIMPNNSRNPVILWLKVFTGVNLFNLSSSLIIGKRFEKEADYFACESGKADGIAKFFKRLKEKDEKEIADFDAACKYLSDNQDKMQGNESTSLYVNYWLSHKLNRAFKWLYYNTSYGPHPSPEERIRLAEEYLDQHKEEEPLVAAAA